MERSQSRARKEAGYYSELKEEQVESEKGITGIDGAGAEQQQQPKEGGISRVDDELHGLTEEKKKQDEDFTPAAAGRGRGRCRGRPPGRGRDRGRKRGRPPKNPQVPKQDQSAQQQPRKRKKQQPEEKEEEQPIKKPDSGTAAAATIAVHATTFQEQQQQQLLHPPSKSTAAVLPTATTAFTSAALPPLPLSMRPASRAAAAAAATATATAANTTAQQDPSLSPGRLLPAPPLEIDLQQQPSFAQRIQTQIDNQLADLRMFMGSNVPPITGPPLPVHLYVPLLPEKFAGVGVGALPEVAQTSVAPVGGGASGDASVFNADSVDKQYQIQQLQERLRQLQQQQQQSQQPGLLPAPPLPPPLPPALPQGPAATVFNIAPNLPSFVQLPPMLGETSGLGTILTLPGGGGAAVGAGDAGGAPAAAAPSLSFPSSAQVQASQVAGMPLQVLVQQLQQLQQQSLQSTTAGFPTTTSLPQGGAAPPRPGSGGEFRFQQQQHK
jgi:hypothetical protein